MTAFFIFVYTTKYMPYWRNYFTVYDILADQG
jgi:hypothetical protein